MDSKDIPGPAAILARLDFNRGCDAGAQRLATPPPPDCGDAIARMEEASTKGDLHAVQDIVAELRGSQAGDYWLKKLGVPLFNAVQNRHKAVVTYLLSEGVIVEPSHVKVTILNKDTAILELFVESGWDINERMEWAFPPPLA